MGKSLLIETAGLLIGGESPRLLPKASVLVSKGRIEKILDPAERREFEKQHAPSTYTKINRKNRFAIPGFVQTHVHLCQTGARGIADDLPLLEWLTKRIFPYEKSLTATTLRQSVRRGLRELLLSGTTTIMDMGTIHHTEVIAEELKRSGIRAIFGKCLVDENPLYPSFQEDRRKALDESISLAKEWHERTPLLRYAWTPRFILACSDTLMKESHALLRDFPRTRFHTHASEHPIEADEIQRRYGTTNIAHLERLGIVTKETCLAHCVQATSKEIRILSERGAHVLHCPSSNLKLGSGIADIVAFKRQGISVSLGADGAPCNNHLDAWTEMRLAALLQKIRHGTTAVPAREAFDLATLAGAKALGWEDETGSLEVGKSADIVYLNLDQPWIPSSLETTEEVLSAIVYSGRPDNVTDVMIHGKWIVQNSEIETL